MNALETSTLKSRLLAAIEVVLDDPGLDPKLKAAQKIFMPLVNNFINHMDEASLRRGLLQFRDEVLPFLLGGESHDPNPNQE